MGTEYSCKPTEGLYPVSWISRLRNCIVLLVLALYLLFNYGFMIVGMPFCSDIIPVGELFLVIFFVTTRHLVCLPPFARQFLFLPYLFWLMLGLVSASWAVQRHGLWALRDATPVIESLFLYVGFVYAIQEESIKRFFYILPKFLIVAVLYGFLFPWRGILQDLSPKLTAPAGYQAPLLFFFTNSGTLLLMASAYLLLFNKGRNCFRFWFVGFTLVYTIFFFQSRTVYLQVIAILAILFWRRPSVIRWGISTTVITALILFAFIGYAGVKIPGRLGYEISIDFLREHFMTIYGQGKIHSAVGGVTQRLDWWRDIYDRLTDSFVSLFFGLGYGINLTKFKIAHGVVVREPHNSFISVVARLGLVGFSCFVMFHLSLLSVWNRTYRWALEKRDIVLQNTLLILLVYAILICVAALGGDAFEKPFNAIPYYFLWGIVLGINFQIRFRSSFNVL